MALVIEVQIEAPAWRKAWPRVVVETRGVLRDASLHLRGLVPPTPRLRRAGMPGPDEHFEVAVVFAADAKLQELNATFRGKDRPTNVLSFSDDAGGGIALSFETISTEARAQGKSFVNHAKHMILHGFLHLHGYDHQQPRAARLMEGLEIAMLGRMGIPNPYLIEKPRA